MGLCCDLHGRGSSFEATTAHAGEPPLRVRCNQSGGLALLGCGHQRIRCASGEAEYPGDVVDAKPSLRPLKVQPRLCGTNEPLGFAIIHDPATPLLLPTRAGTYLTAQVYEQRVPGKSNRGHSSRSAMGTCTVPPRGIAVQDQNLGSTRTPSESAGGPLTGPQTAVKLVSVKAPCPTRLRNRCHCSRTLSPGRVGADVGLRRLL